MSRYHYAGKFNRPDPDDAETTDEVYEDAPVVLNPEAIGDPDVAPIVQLHAGEVDQ